MTFWKRLLGQLSQVPAEPAERRAPDPHQGAGAPVEVRSRVFEHDWFVSCVAFSPSGKEVLIGTWGQARLWSVETQSQVRVFEAPDKRGRVSCVAFSPDGRHVLTVQDSRVYLWDAMTGGLLRTLGVLVDTGGNPDHSNYEMSFNTAAFSSDGQWILAGQVIWDLTAGSHREVPCREPWRRVVGSRASRGAFSSTGRYALLLDALDGVEMWDVRRMKQLWYRRRGPDCAAFSPDEQWVLLGSSATPPAGLLNTRNAKEVRVFDGHSDRVISVAFSPNGRYVLTGSLDKTARLWDTESGRTVRIFSEHNDGVCSVAISPDGKSVLTGSNDKTARLRSIA